ncbi:Smr/MutS family protein [Persicobacter sp. CCB-QB2]|uniref:Smr/MutS family protein n=1 Tax=Persicobacter sp. CCB-QB2 TaxID=1561025 RepID=UPI00092F3D09|nr:Smr/MutS family protein [Persicobacter sp. CCB-QB2]
MNIGDRVRLMHDNQEGIIVNVTKNNIVEIEIEDGFVIPVSAREVVVVAKEETDYFGEGGASATQNVKEVEAVQPKVVNSERGVFMAYTKLGHEILEAILINNTDYSIVYSVSEETTTGNQQGVSAGVILPKNYQRLHKKTIRSFDEWPALVVRYMLHSEDYFENTGLFQRRLKFRASNFFKVEKEAPVLNEKAYVVQIDQDLKAVDAQEIHSKMSQKQAAATLTGGVEKVVRPADKVDLHIEKISTDHEFLKKEEMLELQMEVFAKKLDDAIATGMDEIVFVHGIGNGTLRNKIHKYLSKAAHIKFYEETERTRFGFAATRVKIH